MQTGMKNSFLASSDYCLFQRKGGNISVHVSVVSEDQCLAQGHFVHTAFCKPTAFTVKRGVCHYQRTPPPPFLFYPGKLFMVI